MTQASRHQQTPQVLLLWAMSSGSKTSPEAWPKHHFPYRILYAVLCVKPRAPSPFRPSSRQEMARAFHPSQRPWSAPMEQGEMKSNGVLPASRTKVKCVGTLHWAPSTQAGIREATKKPFPPSFRTFLDSNWLSHASCSASTLPAQSHTTAAYESATDSWPYLK